MKKFNYVYITTNIVNEKQYVGDHSTNDLNDTYLGSGRPHFLNAIEKYGKENFKRKILEYFDTKEEAFDAQEKYINKYNTLAPYGYNISPTGGHGVSGCFSEETLKKLSESNKGKNKGKSAWNKGIPLTKEIKKKISDAQQGEKHWNWNKTLSEETKQKLSEAKKGKKLSEEHKKHLSEVMKGHKHTNEAKRKIGEASKGRKHSEETKLKISKVSKGRKHSEETKLLISKKCKGRIPWNKGLKLNTN